MESSSIALWIGLIGQVVALATAIVVLAKAMERHAKRINGQLGELITAVTKSVEAASIAAAAAAQAIENRDAGNRS